MINTCFRKFVFALLFFVVGYICIVGIGGCSEPVPSGATSDWIESNSELDFQVQSNKPPTTRTLYATAEILATQGRDSECEYVLKRIIQDNPTFLPAYNSLAELQMRRGQTNVAIETLEHALVINSEDPVILNNLGMCWIVNRDYEKALMMFTEAAGIIPENMRYRLNMAVALGLMGRDEESLSLFKQALPEDQANHNLDILREARSSSKSTSETISQD